ncbi:hypothetical protein PILCRDRAFT_8719 [Piloderma croceum F 1598]|uniref:Uncharacterized protein n=1 Tax=Piloderma croceum (strain F 1598) TaxID=765440 RepID=A0A0C3B537_PILCF|nr:hypothetical protein PILCRDRAFT_8719 [Piloderma croceum F 1598]
MPRKSKGVKKPVGRKNDFTGKKLQLLTNFAGHFREAIDNKTPLDFYDRITTLAVKQWGYHEDYSVLTEEDEIEGDNDDDDIPSQFASVNDDEDDEDDVLTVEEAERCQKIYKKLRTKIQQWYRQKYKHVPSTGNSSPADPSTNPFTILLPPGSSKPRRMAEITLYMAMYYEMRIKEEAERRVFMAEQKFDQATEEERAEQDLKKPIPATKKAVKARIEELYDEELKAWRAKHIVPKTPQEYHHQLQTAGEFLHPIAEAIGNMMGVPVAIMMPVPIPEKNGEIECLSVHVDMPAMPIWSGTNTNTTTRSNKCELASNPSKSDKISSVMQLRCLDVDHDTSM